MIFFNKKNKWVKATYWPRWVDKAFHKQFNSQENPYDKIYKFNGKNLRYKVEVVGDVQGGSYYFYNKMKLNNQNKKGGKK